MTLLFLVWDDVKVFSFYRTVEMSLFHLRDVRVHTLDVFLALVHGLSGPGGAVGYERRGPLPTKAPVRAPRDGNYRRPGSKVPEKGARCASKK